MIKIGDYKILSDCVSNFRETSVDNHDKNKRYMTTSTRPVVNFDNVKTEYVKNLGINEVPKSIDALFEIGDEELVFTEFKAGFLNPPKVYGVRKKVYDSVLILCDIMGKGISFTREKVSFILVYNEKENQSNIHDEIFVKNKSDKDSVVQYSSSFNKIAKTIGSYAKEEYICFGLQIFKNYCFKEVHTYTEEEFEEYLKQISKM